MSTEVFVHVAGLRRLADAVRAAGADLGRLAAEADEALRAAEQDVAVAVAVRDAARWADGAADELARLVGVVGVWVAGGRVPNDLVVSSAPLHPALVDPRAAAAVVRSMLEAWASGDRDRFAALLRDHVDDVGVVTLLFELDGPVRVDATFVVDRLTELLAIVGDPNTREDPGSAGGVVVGLARALGNATLAGTSVIGFADLAGRAAASGLPPKGLALLFVPTATFAAGFLVEAASTLVPALASSVHERDLYVGGRDGVVDVRLGLLGHLAVQPSAAARVLVSGDLDALCLPRHRYRDDGRALAEVLLAGADPARGGDGVAATERLVRWVAERTTVDEAGTVVGGPPLAPAAHDALGLIGARALGSLREDALRARGPGLTVDPVPGLDAAAAGRFVQFAARRDAAADALDRATLAWVATEARRLTRGELSATTAQALGEVGGVAGFVFVHLERGRLTAAHEVDLARDRERGWWSLAAGLAATAVTAGVGGQTFVSEVASGAALSGATGLAVDVVRPPTDEAHQAGERALGRRAAHQQVVESLVLSVLWLGQDRNGAFVASPPPRGLLVRGRLPTLAELDDAGRSAYRHWVTGLQGPARLLVDRVGASHGRAG